MKMKKRRRTHWLLHVLATLAIALATLFAYSNSFQAPFLFDDEPNIVQNEQIRIERLDWEELRRAFTQGYLSGRPIAYVTFAFNYYVGGYDVRGYHLFNYGVHLLNSLLVYGLALATLRLFRNRQDYGTEWLDERTVWGIATLAAAIFALHPIQTSSVTYVVQRMNSMATLFYLAALLLYLSGRARVGAARWIRWAGTAACWPLAFLCKQNAVTLPLAILLYEACFHGTVTLAWWRSDRRRIAWTALLLVATAGLLAAVSYPLLRSVGNVFARYNDLDFTMGQRVLTQTRVVAIYADLALAPLPGRFNLLHHVPTSQSLIEPVSTLMAVVFCIAYLVFAFWIGLRNRLFSFCLLWIPLQLAVESSILPIEMIYEHRMYLPMFGLALLVSTLLFRLLSGRWRWLRIPTIVVVATLLGLATYERNKVWGDALSMWNDVIAKNSFEARPFVNRGGVHAQRQNWPKAIRDYNEAIRVDPDSVEAWTTRSGAFTRYAAILLARHNYVEAEAHLNVAVQDATEALERLASPRRSAERVQAYKNRAAARVMLADVKRADASTPEVESSASRSELHELALRDYAEALKLDPGNADCLFNRANLHRAIGNYAEAIADYSRCIEVDPRKVQAYNNLAQLLIDCPDASRRDPVRSLELARAAVELAEMERWELYETLAEAFSANGQNTQAARWQRKAMERAPIEHRSRLSEKAAQYDRKVDEASAP